MKIDLSEKEIKLLLFWAGVVRNGSLVNERDKPLTDKLKCLLSEPGALKIGDRVEVIDDTKYPEVDLMGKIGIVRSFRENGNIGIEFNEMIGGHSCHSTLQNDRGWYFLDSEIIKRYVINKE